MQKGYGQPQATPAGRDALAEDGRRAPPLCRQGEQLQLRHPAPEESVSLMCEEEEEEEEVVVVKGQKDMEGVAESDDDEDSSDDEEEESLDGEGMSTSEDEQQEEEEEEEGSLAEEEDVEIKDEPPPAPAVMAAAVPAPEAAAAAQQEQQQPWEAYPSLAWSRGKAPAREGGIQVHRSSPNDFTVQFLKPAATGNRVPFTLGVFSEKQHAARGRDVAEVWRAQHGVCDITWGSAQFCYPDADYRSDTALREAIQQVPGYADFRLWVKHTFPAPAMVPSKQRKSGDGAAPNPRGAAPSQHRRRPPSSGGQPGVVSKVMTAYALQQKRVCFTEDQLRVLGWTGDARSKELPPPLLVTPAASLQLGGSGGSGSGGGWSMCIALGKFGRDGTCMKVQVVDLFARLAVRANDDLHFRPLPGSSPGGELLVEVSTIRGTAQQQQQPAEPEAMGVGSAVAAGSGSSLLAAGAGGSGSADDRHRRKRSAPSRDDAGGLGLAWAPAPAPAKACANCNIKETCAWRRHPHDRNVVLCNACRSYLDRTGVMSTPEQRRPNYRRRAGRQPQPGSVVAEQPEEEVAAAEPDAKRQRVEEEAQPPAHPTPGQQEQHRSEQLVAPVPTGPPAAPQTGTMAAPSSTPAACGTVAACAAGLEPLPAGTRWDIVHERLDVLLADCGVEEMEAQDFKFALLDMSEERRWSHFREVQAQHGRGKANLVQNWVALLLQQQ